MKELLLKGFNLQKFYEIATIQEREQIKELKQNISFSNEINGKIQSIKEDIYIFASAESWCPYARTFIATIDKASELNNKINLSLITYGRGLIELTELLKINEDDFVIPTAIILDKNFNIISSFIGYPEIYKEAGLKGDLKASYYKGEKANEIIKEILKK